MAKEEKKPEEKKIAKRLNCRIQFEEKYPGLMDDAKKYTADEHIDGTWDGDLFHTVVTGAKTMQAFKEGWYVGNRRSLTAANPVASNVAQEQVHNTVNPVEVKHETNKPAEDKSGMHAPAPSTVVAPS